MMIRTEEARTMKTKMKPRAPTDWRPLSPWGPPFMRRILPFGRISSKSIIRSAMYTKDWWVELRKLAV
jgi:hypothetical protein